MRGPGYKSFECCDFCAIGFVHKDSAGFHGLARSWLRLTGNRSAMSTATSDT